MFDDGNMPDDTHSFGGTWTRIKLEALEKYLVAFNSALKNQSFRRIYIDGFAGTGRCEINLGGEKKSVDGSARRALATDPGFHHYCFIEMDSKKIPALKALQTEFNQKPIEIIQGDANEALKKVCAKYNWKKTRAVAFLDPYGLQVEWPTLEQIAKTQAIDVWYLFPLAGLYRQMARNANAMDEDKENAIIRILGTDEWKQIFYKPSPQSDLFDFDSGEERDADPQQIVEFVSSRLRKVFPSVLDPKILYQNGDKGSPLFALYFCLSNPNFKAKAVATRIANHILKS